MLDTLLKLLEIMVIITGGVSALWTVKKHLLLHTVELVAVKEKLIENSENFSNRLEKVDQELVKVSEAMLQLARQEERLNALDIRLQELSNRITRSPSKRVG